MKKFQQVQEFAAFFQPHVAFPTPHDGDVQLGPIAKGVAQFDGGVQSLKSDCLCLI